MQNSTRTKALTDAKVQAKNEAAIPTSRMAASAVDPSESSNCTMGVELSRTAGPASASAMAWIGTAIR